MQDRLGPRLPGRVGHPGPEDVALRERDAAGVLHGPGVELGAEDLVVLAELVGVGELLGEEVEAPLGDVEDLVRVEVLGERLPAGDGQVDGAVTVVDDVEVPRDDGGDVGRHLRRRSELPPPAGGRVGDLVGRAVRRDVPARRRPHRELEGAFQIRLVEAGVDPMDVVGLCVGVAVDGVVDGVDEAVHPDPVVVEGGAARDLEDVVALQPGEPDAVAVEGIGAHRVPVQFQPRHRRGEVLDKGLRPGGGAVEGDLGHAAEGVRIGIEKVQGYQVRRAGDQPGTLRRLLARQVIREHGPSLT